MIYFWNGWEPIFRIIMVGTLTYIAIISILKISGKRSLARMNAFDFIITITIGSPFGRILTAKEVSLAESITTFILLMGLTIYSHYWNQILAPLRSGSLLNPGWYFIGGNFWKNP